MHKGEQSVTKQPNNRAAPEHLNMFGWVAKIICVRWARTLVTAIRRACLSPSLNAPIPLAGQSFSPWAPAIGQPLQNPTS